MSTLKKNHNITFPQFILELGNLSFQNTLKNPVCHSDGDTVMYDGSVLNAHADTRHSDTAQFRVIAVHNHFQSCINYMTS